MQLIYAKPSPYSRKARVTVIEKGLAKWNKGASGVQEVSAHLTNKAKE